MRINAVTGQIVNAAMKVHTAVGPGLLEGAYEKFLYAELRNRKLRVERQVGLPALYGGEQVDLGYRIDLLVEDAVIVEIKSVVALSNVHQAQLITYLRLSGKSVGLLMNFNVARMREGIVRIVNGFTEE